MNAHARLKNLREEVEREYTQNILPYWYQYSIDEKNGGFFGRVDYQNTPVVNADKGGILNSRILWTFSAAYKQFPSSQALEMAQRAYQFLTERLIDNEFGGVYWSVDYAGNISNPRKHVYVQAFAIYGLTEYYSAFGDERALEKARELYMLIEEKCTDKEYSGYFEAYTRDWNLIDDSRLSEKDKNVPKTMNTHLHVLEGYTNLYRCSPSKNLKERLIDLLHIFDTRIFNKNKTSLICFLDKDWSRKSSRISYGHDIEASWLCCEAAEVIGDSRWVNIFKSISMNVARNVINGTDEDGGMINELTEIGITDSNKDWWPQAEALIGHLNAYQISKDNDFLAAALKSWSFIKQFVIDHKNGEWYEKIDRAGVPYDQLDKIRLWKAPYHNSRAVFEVSKRITELLESEEGEPKIHVNIQNK